MLCFIGMHNIIYSHGTCIVSHGHDNFNNTCANKQVSMGSSDIMCSYIATLIIAMSLINNNNNNCIIL